MAERKPKNTSKIEVIAHKNEIEDLLAKGYNYTLVFNKLKAQNKISCKYHAFLKSTKSICENNKKANQLNKKNKQDNQKKQKEKITQTALKNSPQNDEDRPFRDENKDADELI